jgi:hydrogenase nickel incorporation protein HypA/HybF
MHEFALCQALIAEVEALARQHRARRVAGVRLLVGPLSGTEPVLLQSAFPLAVAGTALDGALLSIDPAPLRVACESCGAESEAVPNRLVCAACGDWHTRILSGDELTLASVELIVEQDAATDSTPERVANHV